MDVKIVKCKHCICTWWRVASVGITLLGVTHPIWKNFLGAGQAPVGGSHPGLRE